MADRVVVIIEDDWEIAGDGRFNVASHQYVPAAFLIKTCRRLGIKATFCVEVAQQLSFIKYEDDFPNLKLQRRLWEDSIHFIKSSGFDIQLHIHPQWLDVTMEKGEFITGRNWNIATCEPESRRQLLEEARDYLLGVVQQVDSSARISAFKAGAWGLQPWRELVDDLRAIDIEVVMGPAKGLRIITDEFRADYTTLQEGTLPYYPQRDDICRMSNEARYPVVLPTGWVTRTLWLKALGLMNLVRKTGTDKHDVWRLLAEQPNPDGRCSPIEPKSGAVDKVRKLLAISGNRHLHIGGESFAVMKYSFDAAMRRLLARPEPTLPLLIESHTKSFWGGWHNIERFLEYICQRYGSVIEFQTLSEFTETLRAGFIPVSRANDSQDAERRDEVGII